MADAADASPPFVFYLFTMFYFIFVISTIRRRSSEWPDDQGNRNFTDACCPVQATLPSGR